MYPFNASLVGMLDIRFDILKICMKKFNAEKIFLTILQPISCYIPLLCAYTWQ